MSASKEFDLSADGYLPQTVTLEEARKLYKGETIAVLVTAEDLDGNASHGAVLGVGAKKATDAIRKAEPPDDTYLWLLKFAA